MPHSRQRPRAWIRRLLAGCECAVEADRLCRPDNGSVRDPSQPRQGVHFWTDVAGRLLIQMLRQVKRNTVGVCPLREGAAMAWTLSIDTLTEVEALRILRRMIRKAVELEGAGSDAFDIELALGEALANARVHAYPGKVGTVEINVSYDNGTFTVTVRDRGEGTSLPVVPETIHHNGDRPSHGFGLFTISKLMDNLEIAHAGDQPGQGIRVTMTKRLGSLEST
jgi:stage II sporulation protein AB (anti-sigma F factor)